MKKITQLLLLIAACLLPASFVNGQLIVHEGFDYADGSTLGGADGGLGFSAGWTVTNGTGPELTIDASSSISFGGLDTSGGFIFRPNRTNITTISRTLDAASVSALTGDGTTLWGSFVYRHANGDGFLADSSLTLASVATSTSNQHLLSAVGNGFGVLLGENDDDVDAVFYQASQAADETAPTTYTDVSGVSATVAEPVAMPKTSLIVFSIDWNPDGTADVLTLYNLSTADLDAGVLPAFFATTSVDFTAAEQATFNSLNIVEAQTGEFDEIRLGTTLADVIPTSTAVILGDCDMNGVVNFLDISPFISILSGTTFVGQADCNEDGMVSFLDISPFITILAGS